MLINGIQKSNIKLENQGVKENMKAKTRAGRPVS
jgi:hypothetical protein